MSYVDQVKQVVRLFVAAGVLSVSASLWVASPAMTSVAAASSEIDQSVALTDQAPLTAGAKMSMRVMVPDSGSEDLTVTTDDSPSELVAKLSRVAA